MEVEALKLMKVDLYDQRIEFFTSDGDVKIRNVIVNLKRFTPLKKTIYKKIYNFLYKSVFIRS